MQDTYTGSMIPVRDLTQESLDAAIPDRSRQGGKLAVGMTVDLNGCHFRIERIRKRTVLLRGIKAPKPTQPQ